MVRYHTNHHYTILLSNHVNSLRPNINIDHGIWMYLGKLSYFTALNSWAMAGDDTSLINHESNEVAQVGHIIFFTQMCFPIHGGYPILSSSYYFGNLWDISWNKPSIWGYHPFILGIPPWLWKPSKTTQNGHLDRRAPCQWTCYAPARRRHGFHGETLGSSVMKYGGLNLGKSMGKSTINEGLHGKIHGKYIGKLWEIPS